MFSHKTPDKHEQNTDSFENILREADNHILLQSFKSGKIPPPTQTHFTEV